MIGGGGGRDIINARSSGQRRGRRDRAERRDPRHGRRGAPPLDGSALQPARRRRRPSATGARRSRPRRALRPDPHRLHRHPERQLGAGVRPHRVQPVHARGLRRVPRPPRSGRSAERLAAATAGRRRGSAGDGPHARGAAAPRRPRSVAQRRGDDRRGLLRRRIRHRARPQGAVHAARADPGAPARRERGLGVAYAPGGPYQQEWAGLGASSRARSRSAAPTGSMSARRPTTSPSSSTCGGSSDIGSSETDGYFYSIDPVRDPTRRHCVVLVVLSLFAFVLPLALVRGPRRPPPRSLRPVRRDRPRLPGARGIARAALRAVPRLPHLRAVRRAVRPAPLHRGWERS